MQNVLIYINDNIKERLALEDVAKKFGYSKWYFCDCFKQFTGVTFGEYIKNHRMQLALIDILDGKKVIDVAVEYGYETQSGFNKAFLTQFGCFPKEFKGNHLKIQKIYEERRI